MKMDFEVFQELESENKRLREALEKITVHTRDNGKNPSYPALIAKEALFNVRLKGDK